MNRQLRVVHVRRQVGEAVVELAAHILGQLDGGHGEALVRPLALHLEGSGGAQLVPQVVHGALHNGVPVLGAGPGPAYAHRAEQLAHGGPGALEVEGIVQRLHIGGGLAGVDLEGAVFLQPPLGVAHHFLLKAPAVEALEHHLSLLEQDDLFHTRPLLSTSDVPLFYRDGGAVSRAGPPPPGRVACADRFSLPPAPDCVKIWGENAYTGERGRGPHAGAAALQFYVYWDRI